MALLPARILDQHICQLRFRRGLTQQDLVGGDYSKSYISAIERGKARLSIQAVQRIASRLGVSVDTLLDSDTLSVIPDKTDAPSPRYVEAGGRKEVSELATHNLAQ